MTDASSRIMPMMEYSNIVFVSDFQHSDRTLSACDHTCSYLGVLEKSRDASDVQTEASRGASSSVNTGSEERVVLLLR